jgi:transcriptional regulator with XRE-family HTH domain
MLQAYQREGSARTMRQNEDVPPSAVVDPALAAVVARRRSELGLSQEQVAARAQITAGSYRKVELARTNPAWSIVKAIAAALEVTLEELGRLVEAEG